MTKRSPQSRVGHKMNGRFGLLAMGCKGGGGGLSSSSLDRSMVAAGVATDEAADEDEAVDDGRLREIILTDELSCSLLTASSLLFDDDLLGETEEALPLGEVPFPRRRSPAFGVGVTVIPR